MGTFIILYLGFGLFNLIAFTLYDAILSLFKGFRIFRDDEKEKIHIIAFFGGPVFTIFGIIVLYVQIKMLIKKIREVHICKLDEKNLSDNITRLDDFR